MANDWLSRTKTTAFILLTILYSIHSHHLLHIRGHLITFTPFIVLHESLLLYEPLDRLTVASSTTSYWSLTSLTFIVCRFCLIFVVCRIWSPALRRKTVPVDTLHRNFFRHLLCTHLTRTHVRVPPNTVSPVILQYWSQLRHFNCDLWSSCSDWSSFKFLHLTFLFWPQWLSRRTVILQRFFSE